eukprot:238113-Pyramimonas_sp.AAC.1
MRRAPLGGSGLRWPLVGNLIFTVQAPALRTSLAPSMRRQDSRKIPRGPAGNGLCRSPGVRDRDPAGYRPSSHLAERGPA